MAIVVFISSFVRDYFFSDVNISVALVGSLLVSVFGTLMIALLLEWMG